MDMSNQESVQKLVIGLLVATLFILGFNALRLSSLSDMPLGAGSAASSGISGAAVTATAGPDFLPKSVPAIYGKELKVSFDDVSANDPEKADATISKLGLLDQQITLSGADKERYINVLYTLNNGISCEYCCGARAIIFSNGEPACGCAHSYAMRGLTKYLITKHGAEYTDEQLLEEAGKWKALFFPGQMALKAQVLQSKGIELNFVNLVSNKYRGVEKDAGTASGGMVGGC